MVFVHFRLPGLPKIPFKRVFLKPSLPTHSGRREQGRPEADLGPNLGPPEAPESGPNRLPKALDFQLCSGFCLGGGLEALWGVKKQMRWSFGAGPAECAGRRGTFKEGYKSRSDLEEALDKNLETGFV